MKLQIIKSHLPNKKFDAVFTDKDAVRVIPFGATGYSDYTINKDPKRREAYIKRHQKTEHFDSPMTAGSLSRWLLWGDSTSMNTNIKAFKKRFDLQ